MIKREQNEETKETSLNTKAWLKKPPTLKASYVCALSSTLSLSPWHAWEAIHSSLENRIWVFSFYFQLFSILIFLLFHPLPFMNLLSHSSSFPSTFSPHSTLALWLTHWSFSCYSWSLLLTPERTALWFLWNLPKTTAFLTFKQKHSW